MFPINKYLSIYLYPLLGISQVFKPIVGNIQSLLIPDIEKFINLGPDCLVKTYRKIFIQKNMIFNPQFLIYLHAL